MFHRIKKRISDYRKHRKALKREEQNLLALNSLYELFNGKQS